MKTVYVVGRDGSVESLFEERGWKVRSGQLPSNDILSRLDLVIFTGGSDIDPKWYGEENIASYLSEYSRRRDDYEFHVYEVMNEREIPKAGICRGGQLFNIANGGKMIQDIRGHTGGNHRIMGRSEGGEFLEVLGMVNSCHHQQMIPTDEKFVLAVSDDDVPEVIFYPDRKDLCFQAHPEWGHKNTTDLFFDYISTCLGVK